jgi:hypothetical protein
MVSDRSDGRLPKIFFFLKYKSWCFLIAQLLLYSPQLYSQQLYSQQLYSQQLYSQQLYSQQLYSARLASARLHSQRHTDPNILFSTPRILAMKSWALSLVFTTAFLKLGSAYAILNPTRLVNTTSYHDLKVDNSSTNDNSTRAIDTHHRLTPRTEWGYYCTSHKNCRNGDVPTDVIAGAVAQLCPTRQYSNM